MLKTTGWPNEPASSRNDGNRLACKKNNGKGEVDGFDNDGVEYKSQKIWKAKNCLSPENQLCQEKFCQKVGIYQILTIKITGLAF